MAENNDVPGSPDADEPTTVIQNDAVVPAAEPAAEPVPAADGPRLRDTVWNFRSMVAVSVGALIIGGAIGAALMAATNNNDGPDRVRITTFRGEPGNPGQRGGQPGFGQGGQGQGLGGLSGLGGTLSDEQRQRLQDFVEQKMKQFEQFQQQNPQKSPTAPTPSPSTAG